MSERKNDEVKEDDEWPASRQKWVNYFAEYLTNRAVRLQLKPGVLVAKLPSALQRHLTFHRYPDGEVVFWRPIYFRDAYDNQDPYSITVEVGCPLCDEGTIGYTVYKGDDDRNLEAYSDCLALPCNRHTEEEKALLCIFMLVPEDLRFLAGFHGAPPLVISQSDPR